MAAPGTTRIVPRASAIPRAGRLPAALAPLLVFALTLGLYLATLTGVHTFDALSYILDVQRKPWHELFHPHHLAYGPLGWAAFHAARALGYQGPASLPLQLVNACAGALGVALFFHSLRRITAQPAVALACTALLASSYAFWYYAVEVEVYTLAALFLIACLGQLAQLLKRPYARGYALLGLLQGLAILFHQTNLLLCLSVAVGLLLGVRATRSRLRLFGAYTAPLAATVGLPYLSVALLSGLTSWAKLRDWLLSYAETGWWGGPITASKWQGLGEGLSLTLADHGGALLGLLLLGLIVLHAHRLGSPRNPRGALALVCLSWLLAYGAFFLWWEPDNIEFWIASLPPALLLLALILTAGEARWRLRPGLWLSLAVAASMAAINGQAIALRGDPARDLQRQIVDALVAASKPDDLLLVPDGLQELYLPFYQGRFAYASWNQTFYDHGPAWAPVCAAMQQRIEAALHAGAAVIIADDVLHPPPLLLARLHVNQAQVASCLEPYAAAATPLAMPGPQPPALRLPTADELAHGAGWRFERMSWGWQGSNLAEARFERGWRFVPGNDPALLSPRLNLDASQIADIEILLADEGTQGTAQLFWAGPDGHLSEAQSLRWPLRSGRHSYRLELRGQPGWQGRITRLRLDPVASGNGRPLRLIAIRFR